jgi:hypothetical protein
VRTNARYCSSATPLRRAAAAAAAVDSINRVELMTRYTGEERECSLQCYSRSAVRRQDRSAAYCQCSQTARFSGTHWHVLVGHTADQALPTGDPIRFDQRACVRGPNK